MPNIVVGYPMVNAGNLYINGLGLSPGTTNLLVDIADIQYHPYPDSKFATKFEEAFTGMRCTLPKFITNVKMTSYPSSIYPWKKMILQIST